MTTMGARKKPSQELRLAAALEFSRSVDPLVRRRALEMAATLGKEGADLLWNGLMDSEPMVRESAIQIGAQKLPAARLLSGVGSEGNSVLRTASIEAMRRKGAPSLPALKKGILAEDQDVVLFSVQILGSMPEIEAVPLLIPFLKHEDLNIAQAAVDSLGELKSTKAVGPLLEMLGGDLWLRFAAILALGRIGDARATLDLLGLIDDDTLGSTVLEAIGRIGDPSALARLCRALAFEDRYPPRDTILLAIGDCLRPTGARINTLAPDVTARFESEAFQRYVREAVRASKPQLRTAVNRFVQALYHPPLFPELIEHLDDETLSPETVAFIATLPMANGVEPILQASITHERAGVRAAALRVLGLRSEAWADPLLIARLSDPDPEVLSSAVRAISRRAPVGVFGQILPLLFHPAEAVRTRALEALPTLARRQDVDAVRELLLNCKTLDDQVTYVELSRRLERSAFTDIWLKLLPEASADLLRVLLRALGDGSGPEVRSHLLPFLDHPSSAIRTLAIESLSQSGEGHELGAEFHRRLLTDRECTYYLVRALGRLKYTPVEEDLEALYERAAPLEKIAILEAVGAMETPEAAHFLKAELESKDRERRRAAGASLARHFRDGNLPLFLKLARSEDWALRNTAAWAMGEMKSAEVRPHLKKLTEDPEEVVSRTARSAIDKLPG
ncbi:MAG: HEAT repeat domain-containing protein [Thermoanaerobaculia bacterium]